MSTRQTITGRIAKVDEDRRLVFGWAYVAVDKSGTAVVDHSGDVMDVDSLEDVVYDYVVESREGNVMHAGEPVSTLVESVMLTPEKLQKMGIADAPQAAWWVGFRVNDDAVWQRVKSGELAAFSIEGMGMREELAA